MIKSYFREPWKNYTEVDQATKAHWWNMWKVIKTNSVINSVFLYIISNNNIIDWILSNAETVSLEA